MIGIQTQIALANFDRANRRLALANRRLAIIKIMMGQFQEQCNALPVDDPMRMIVETFIKAVTDAADGVVYEESDSIVIEESTKFIVPG